MTGDEPGDFVVHVDPAIPAGAGYVFRRGTDGSLEETVPARFTLVLADELKLLGDIVDEGVGERWANLTPDPLRPTLPLQQPTLDAFTRGFRDAGRAAQQFGKAAHMLKIRSDLLNSSLTLRRKHPRTVSPVPPIVPPGLSRVDSARARSARSALLRSRRRAIRHNRALPRPRARVRVTAFDPKITWGEPRPEDRQNDRVDAALFALTSLTDCKTADQKGTPPQNGTFRP